MRTSKYRGRDLARTREVLVDSSSNTHPCPLIKNLEKYTKQVVTTEYSISLTLTTTLRTSL
jgi:hypothetical protein